MMAAATTLHAICVVVLSISAIGWVGAIDGPPVRLVSAADLPTFGCAGFKHFVLNGSAYLAIANFWDGTSHGMAANSELVRVVVEGGEGSDSATVSFDHMQFFPTKGAHGWDYFEASNPQHVDSSTLHFLTVPNYYGCGSDRGPAADDCHNTIVYRASSHHRSTPLFKLHQSISTAGPAQTNHFTVPATGEAFLVVGENFNHEVCLYRLQVKKSQHKRVPLFEKYRCLHVPGAGAVATAVIGSKVYLIASSYHSSKTGWSTKSPIFVADAGSDAAIEFSLLQEIETFGCHDVSYGEINGVHYVFLAEDRSAKSPRINSTMLFFNPSSQRFEVLQKLPSYGAHGGKVFEGPDGRAYVMIANFGDRKKKKYKAMSSLWRQVSSAGPADGPRPPLFEKVAEVLSYGATSAEWFVAGGRHYVALANEGDLSGMKHQSSAVYQVRVDEDAAVAAARADDAERDEEA